MLRGLLEEGSLFAGDYRIVRLLREGGMGAVYVVLQESTGKERALKVMRPELVANEALRERFKREARAGAAIESEHVVEVQRAGIDEATGTPFLVMKLLRGKALDEAMASYRTFPPAQVRLILGELCHAVGAAHRAGIVHRDLKPENVFLAETKRAGQSFMVKVLDFGIAKLAAETRLTGAIGSPIWMAPEQTKPGNISPAADVWSMGLLTFQLLTGVPFWRALDSEAASVEMILRAILIDPIPSAGERAEERGAQGLVPAGFDAWFGRCVVREPSARFPSAREAFEALAPILDSAAASGSTRVSPRSTGPARSPMGTPLPPPAPSPRRPAPRTMNPAGAPASTAFELGEFDAQTKVSGVPQAGDAARGSAVPVGTTFDVQDFQGRPPAPIAPPKDALAPVPASWPLPWWKWLVPVGAVLVVLGAMGALFRIRADEPDGGKPDAPPPPTEDVADTLSVPEGMVLIPGGTVSVDFIGEKLVQPYTVDSFWMDVAEVTVAAYGACVRVGKCVATSTPYPSCNGDRADRQTHPVNCVDWNEATAYCKWAGKELPSDKQWLYAARGTDGRNIHGGTPSLERSYAGTGMVTISEKVRGVAPV